MRFAGFCLHSPSSLSSDSVLELVEELNRSIRSSMFSESTYLKTLVVAMHLVHSDPAPSGHAVQFYDGFTMALASGVKSVAEKGIRNVKEGKRRSKQVKMLNVLWVALEHSEARSVELGEETKRVVGEVAVLLEQLGGEEVPEVDQDHGHVKELVGLKSLTLLEGWVELERCWMYRSECVQGEAERRRVEGVKAYAKKHGLAAQEEVEKKEFVYTYGSADMDVDEGVAAKGGIEKKNNHKKNDANGDNYEGEMGEEEDIVFVANGKENKPRVEDADADDPGDCDAFGINDEDVNIVGVGAAAAALPPPPDSRGRIPLAAAHRCTTKHWHNLSAARPCPSSLLPQANRSE